MNFYLLEEAGVVIAAALLVSFLCSIRWVPRRGVSRPAPIGTQFLAFAGACLPLAMIAFATGYLTGFSREPVTSATIPAVLTLLGAVFAYINATHPKASAPMAVGIMLFALVLVLSTSYYATVRENEKVTRLLLLSEEERVIRIRRQNMDLPTDFPDWILPGESSK